MIAADLGGVVNRTVHLEIGTGQVTMKRPDAVKTLTLTT